MDVSGNGSAPRGGVDKAADYANYFSTYALLYQQKEMLADRVRMDAYYNSVFRNKHHFVGKTVLDVGTGTGILAVWCAQAGAKKVYAVEATKMSEHACKLVKENNVSDIVEVIEGTMEDVTLPEKVDVIISEWMGYFLLVESMFDSVIWARDKWLKPGGLMYPSHARIWLAPIASSLADQKMHEYESAMDDWHSFVSEMKQYYGVSMKTLTKDYREEHEKYYLQTSLWNNLEPDLILGNPSVIKEIDCLNATVDDIRALKVKFSSSIFAERARMSGFAGWFDAQFQGSSSNPAKEVIKLNTAPSSENPTHWGQQVFLIHPQLRVNKGDDISVTFSMSRSKENHRLLDAEFNYELRKFSGELLPPVTSKFFILNEGGKE